MPALADMTPKELRDLKRLLTARIKRRSGAIQRAIADRSACELRLSGVQREIEQRAKRAKGNSRSR